MGMFCFQCEQTAGGKGCTKMGVCGKDENVAALQDVLLYNTKGISVYANAAAKLGKQVREIDVFTIEALFSTVTNVDFDVDRLIRLIEEAAVVKHKAADLYNAAAGENVEKFTGPALFGPAKTLNGLLEQAQTISIEKRKEENGDDIVSLKEIITYGLKGAAAYADHAQVLGKESTELYALFHEALAFVAKEDCAVDDLIGWCLKTGDINMKAMELLDAANTESYGHPEPTEVRIEPVKGKAILVSGHDLKDLEELLKQTDGKGINVYTHGEMLPALAYPELKKYKHLAGNYGSAWQNQAKEFDEFPGAILMTTNCIQKPRDTYKARIFTSGLVAWPGVTHISNQNFKPVIDAALEADGFAEDGADKKITIGFARNTVMSVADKVIDGVKNGAIKHFFLVGGCDGAKPGRNYYTELVEKIPQDCVILTLACGKYRFNKMELGDIGGIPRLLDIGQCNDAYSAIQIAVALANVFECGVNDLPLSLILSWYEQKAVAILLTLLNLGIKNIKIGPSLPAFVSPTVLNVLVEKFNIAPITTPDEDLKQILG